MAKTEFKEKQLEGIIKKYTAAGDFQTARNYAKTWGPQIEGYPVDVKLQEIDKLEETGNKKKNEKEVK